LSSAITSPRFTPILESHAPGFGQFGILIGQNLLRLNCALDCIHRAGEFDKQAVAGGTDDAAMELGDLGLDHLGAQPLETS
jgi:hypothetical protein